MNSNISDLEEQARDLSPADRARLAMRLIESLDPGHEEDADELWLDEAERRLRDHDSGNTTARPARDAISEIQRKLK